jgi:hypothetical protein
MAVWYNLWSFGIYFPFWYVWTKKNLATIVWAPKAIVVNNDISHLVQIIKHLSCHRAFEETKTHFSFIQMQMRIPVQEADEENGTKTRQFRRYLHAHTKGRQFGIGEPTRDQSRLLKQNYFLEQAKAKLR